MIPAGELVFQRTTKAGRGRPTRTALRSIRIVRLIRVISVTVLLVACSRPRAWRDPCTHHDGSVSALSPSPRAIKTVFVIMMENKNWSDVRKHQTASYLNSVLIPQASVAPRYSNSGLHPSEPNYLWLEGGTDYGIRDDEDPHRHHLANKDHLVSLLAQAGISWKAYEEGIDGRECPLVSKGRYAAKHNPFVFFDDVTEGSNPRSANCIAHIRPLQELAADLQTGKVARYNFITPDLCNDMHDVAGCATADSIANGDRWLAEWVPRIRGSRAYTDGGAVFLLWDESEEGDHPMGLVVLSPAAKGGGYSSPGKFSHSSTVRTLQEIFGVGPLLCDAANATNLSDLFRAYP